jgi:hypothetical protein
MVLTIIYIKNQKNWIENIALEAETAIGRLEPNEQCAIRYIVAKKLEKLIKANNNRIQKP